MSLRAMTWAWQQDTLSSGERLVLLALADHAGEDGECWPHTARLAEKCALGPKVVQRHLTALHERGIITKVERRKRSNGTLAGWLYRLEIDGCASDRGDSQYPSETGTGVTHERGLPVPLLEGTPSTPQEPSLEPSSVTVTFSLSQDTVTEGTQLETIADARARTTDDGFAEFWSMYPRKIGKPKCGQRWRRMTREQRAAALRALPDHLEHWRRNASDVRFVPHPLTWLNAERWTDELASDFEPEPERKEAPGMGAIRAVIERAQYIDAEVVSDRAIGAGDA